MTNKNDSAELARFRINRQKLDSLNPTVRPGLYEVGTLDDGTIIVTRAIGTTKPSPVPAERRSE